MKTKLLFFSLGLASLISMAQTTYVPDDAFEQALIDFGYDTGPLDDYVPTSNINTVTSLYVSSKGISDLTGIEDFTSLEILWCIDNQLSSLDVSQNTSLTELWCYNNQIPSLDVTQNTALELLRCQGNLLPDLDVTQNTSLTILNCGNNLICSLDVSQNTALTFLVCEGNQLTFLNVKNGNNTAIPNESFYAWNNPDLTCIQVDDAVWSTTNWTNIGGQTSFSEDCNNVISFAGLSLYPYNLHLTMNSTSSEPLVVKNESGEIVTGDVQFYGFTNDLISVSNDGYVTGLRQESSNEKGTRISAKINGQVINNECVVRVLTQDYNLNFISETTSNTILYYPTIINGEDIQQYVVQYEIPTVNQYTYEIQNELMDLQPFNGNKQIIEVDFGESEQQRVCGLAGNPVRLGWNIQENVWQNCFLVPIIQPRSPQWFVFAHEVAHNFTLASNIFRPHLHTHVYIEGIASALGGLESFEKILLESNKYPIQNDAKISIQGEVNALITESNNSFNSWLNNGASFSELSANIVTAIYYKYKTEHPENFGKRFFLPLQERCSNELTSILDDITSNGENGKHTFFAALISAVIKEDVSEEFIQLYNYPIVQSLFDEAFPILMNLMDASVLSVDSKIFLQGSYDTNTCLMTDDLRSTGNIPTTSPYVDGIIAEATVFDLGGTSTTGLPEDDIVDWVWVEIRDSADGTTVIDSMSALLQRDGDLVDVDGISLLTTEAPADNYYLMISHRNHLGVLTASTVSLSGCMSLDLTLDSALVEGGTNGIKDMGDGSFAIFAGDFNGDGQVQNTDKNAVEPLRGISGYENADIDMNGEVQNTDINTMLNPNIGKGEQFARRNLKLFANGSPTKKDKYLKKS